MNKTYIVFGIVALYVAIAAGTVAAGDYKGGDPTDASRKVVVENAAHAANNPSVGDAIASSIMDLIIIRNKEY